MKLKLKSFLTAILALTAFICSVLGLTACNGVKITEIVVENEQIEFMIGDEFTLGEYFTAYALYSDGSKEDVTDKVDVKRETGFDMNVAGDYQITVSYEGKKFVYTIYVGSFENILRKIELDTTDVKTTYKVGESVSYDGIKIISTLENAQGNNVTSTTSSLKGFSTKVVSENGATIDEVFTEFGEYTITVSKGAIGASYTVTADGVDISSVQGALAVGSLFKSEVVSGAMQIDGAITVTGLLHEYNNTYTFGKSYTYIKETIENAGEYYMSMDDKGFFCVFVQDEKAMPSYVSQTAMMDGPGIPLWYMSRTEYGIENALNNLYSQAKKCTNNDLKETVDEATMTYSFSFSGLVLTMNNSPDYYETTVTFKLGEKYNIEHAEFTQTEWENDQAMLETDKTWDVTFTIDPQTGKTTPNGRYSSQKVVVVDQTAGERTLENPYSRDTFTIKSYDLIYNGQPLEDGAVVKCNMTSPNITLKISNILPTTANTDMDEITINYEGNHAGYGITQYFDGFTAYVFGGNIYVTLMNGGVWKLYIKTANTLKTVTFDVTGVAPTAMTANIRNEATGEYYAGSTKLLQPNGEVYFYGAVGKYENYAQTAVVTSANASSATIEKFTETGKTYFKFTASEKGEYTVRVTSDVASSVNCTFTFTVSDIPDYASILQGNYTATDVEGNIYEISFTPASGDKISGTMTVKMTPTEENGTPVTSEAKSENYTYEVDLDALEIKVMRVSGDKLAVLLSVNASGKLVLEDAYELKYELTKVN